MQAASQGSSPDRSSSRGEYVYAYEYVYGGPNQPLEPTGLNVAVPRNRHCAGGSAARRSACIKDVRMAEGFGLNRRRRKARRA